MVCKRHTEGRTLAMQKPVRRGVSEVEQMRKERVGRTVNRKVVGAWELWRQQLRGALSF